MAGEKMIRMSLDLTPEMKESVDSLAAAAGINNSELLRRAISLMKAVKEGEKRGESPALVKDNQIVARIVGI
ncbi:MAG: ribbon-helix-helix protein, CopG family [Vulcanimicrobiota bacterium]